MGTHRPTVQSVRQRAAAVRSGQTGGGTKETIRPSTAETRTADIAQPPAQPANVPDALLDGVTSQPVSVVRGHSRIWTGDRFETVECVTAVIFVK